MALATISPCPHISKETGEVKISNTIQWGENQTWELEFSFDNDQLPLTGGPDPWLVLALLPAMRAGMDLELTRPVSAQLLENLPTIQNIFNTWDPSYKKIKINAPARNTLIYSGERKTGCFFSGGVDSFYTVLKHHAEIDVLIHLDNPWAGEAGRARLNGKIKETAHRLGKPLILIKSNFRGFVDTYTNWELSHGASMLALASLLTPYLSKVFLASDYTYSSLEPDGAYPLLDPLWGTENLEIIHDGLEANRLQKIQFMAQNEIMLSSLRVCWTNIENELNCGRCRKCLTTLVSLRVAGVLARCTTFAVPLDLDYLVNFEYDTLSSRWSLLENLEVLEKRQDDPELEAAVRQTLANQTLHPHIKRVAGTDPELFELRRKVDYFDQALRFQLVEKLNGLLSKNRAVHRASEALAHGVWKLFN